MNRPRQISKELIEQGMHDIEWRSGSEINGWALGEAIGRKRERQRMVVRELKYVLMISNRDSTANQVGAALLRIQVSQRQDRAERLPADVRAPSERHGLATGDHD